MCVDEFEAGLLIRIPAWSNHDLIPGPAELLAAGAGTKSTIEVPESLFRAYDIRGVGGEALTPALAELLGQGVAGLVRERGGERVAVARDSLLRTGRRINERLEEWGF